MEKRCQLITENYFLILALDKRKQGKMQSFNAGFIFTYSPIWISSSHTSKASKEVEDRLARAVADCLSSLENACAVTHSDLSVQWHHSKCCRVDKNQNSVAFESVFNTDT